MRIVRDHLARSGDDDGITLVEVIVAMFIFAIISSSVIFGMLQVLESTRDSRARQVAANLASQEIDLARDAPDLFALLDSDRTATLNGDVFSVHRATSWVSNPGTPLACGSGGGTLRYKRVNVTVTWANMRSGTPPVRSDTVINPATQINDPALGTILVSVLGVAGTGAAGITVTATPSSPANGATALTTTPAATDAQGCTYILKVTPGNYDVTVSRSGYIDETQSAGSSTRTVGVSAGASASVSFAFDAQATFNATYGAGYTPVGAEVVRMPAQPTTSFGSTHSSTGAFVVTPAATSTLSAAYPLFPFDSGYQLFAGSCAAADPAAWPNTAGSPVYSGVRALGVATPPGTSISTDVAMGVVKLALGAGGAGKNLRAVSADNVLAGDPGCAVSTTFSFGNGGSYAIPASGDLTVLLPYGSWTLSYGTGGTETNWITPVTAVQMSLPTTPVPERSSIAATGIVTFDPRVVVP